MPADRWHRPLRVGTPRGQGVLASFRRDRAAGTARDDCDSARVSASQYSLTLAVTSDFPEHPDARFLAVETMSGIGGPRGGWQLRRTGARGCSARSRRGASAWCAARWQCRPLHLSTGSPTSAISLVDLLSWRPRPPRVGGLRARFGPIYIGEATRRISARPFFTGGGLTTCRRHLPTCAAPARSVQRHAVSHRSQRLRCLRAWLRRAVGALLFRGRAGPRAQGLAVRTPDHAPARTTSR
jgi:hypothetical protein